MASSQVVEMASSSPFGCVLRDRNHRDGCRESNVKATHAAFQRNIKNFVMDHINTCMSMSSDSTNENTNNTHMNNNGSWVSKARKNRNLHRLHFNRTNHDINNDKDETSLASLISPRHSRLLDRWAARQAREMVSTLENEAELLSMNNNNNHNNNNGDMFTRTCNSSSSDEPSSEISNLGASSLVQIWEKRLNQCNGSKPIERISPNAASASSNNENASSVEEQCIDGPPVNEESFPDWESDKTGHSDQSVSPRGRSCSPESDRVSVADIIKKLTATNHNQSPTPSFGDDNENEVCGGSSSVTGSPCREREFGGFTQEQLEHKAFPQMVTSSLRIRGRRAYNDLLMQLEHDRYGELKNLAERGSVSKFTHRGRIQSVLRLRLLQRGAAANDPPSQKSTASEVNRQQQGSAIMQLRERFNIGVELRTTVQGEVASPRNPHREIVNNNTQLANFPSTDQLSKDTSSQTPHGIANHSTESTQKSVSHTAAYHNREKAHPSSDVMFQETSFQAQHHEPQETAEATTPMTDSNLNETDDRVETSNKQNDMAKSSNEETVNEEEASNRRYAEISYEETVEEEDVSNQNYAESSYDEMVEEVETIDQNYDEINYDWISEISRPRSYWEERRQAWYREMLDNDSHNEDIRKLLERQTVSNFLSSDFRERMDRLMESHRGTQTHVVNSYDNHEEDNQGLIVFLQEHLHNARAPQEDGRESGEEEEEVRINQDGEEEEDEEADEQEHEHEEEHEGESLISGSYHEVGKYSNQSSSWSFGDNEAGDEDLDRDASTSSPQPYQSQPFYQDSRRCSSSTNHHSIEMELIYDLRGHMDQLYHEISELRKSIKGCMDMQMQLQKSMNREVHTVKNEEKKPHNKAPKKGNCCICYEMKVDSLLYRCGHMCTCLKCANELQWNSGKCPICRAKIVDVVRVYVDD
ncbi:GATA zinc finger domain-containing protein 7-like [Abrus precatorius]|uniref:GATA zinc finger domain-containing protein 7-like n=1 Tax=Abrus precatorius TaxID=3816 RepID=A0A8B8K6W3_ABRPR|nr:GATA zinc finger domain-containing protein 7-like [Abrus precatorius]